PTATRALAGSPSRWNATAVLLPTGEVLVTGGVQLTAAPDGTAELSDDNAVLAAELYDPVSGGWFELPAATVPRNYHSVAVILPDGRVWTAGSNHNTWLGAAFVEKRMEIHTPWYCSPGLQRPVITGAPDI